MVAMLSIEPLIWWPKMTWVLRLLLGVVLPLLVLVVGCSIQQLRSGQTLTQGNGLPSLHQLDWGIPFVEGAVWSPNGRWIAVMAGSGPGDEQLEVVSPDGHYRHSLASWGCGSPASGIPAYAWQPDNALSCLDDSELITGSYPFTAPQHVSTNPTALLPEGLGGTWSPDGHTFLVSLGASPTNPGYPANAQIYAVSPSGVVSLQPLTPANEDVAMPAWQPHQMAVSYTITVGPEGSEGYGFLLSTVQMAGAGKLALSAPRTVVPSGLDVHYCWSPSGHWLAVRYGNYVSGDKIYLLNPAHPSQTVDVVVASQVGQQMMAPIWSPDGQQMIVFTVGYGTSQPYELDIGAYLHSKGIQP